MQRRFLIGLLAGCLGSGLLFLAVRDVGAARQADRVLDPPQPSIGELITRSSEPLTKTFSIDLMQSPTGGGGGGDVVTTFTYQGYLKKNGVPYTGNCDMRFKLWDGYSTGTLLTTTTPLPYPVTVNNGLFTTWIDFGDQFKGAFRYIETDVSCPASASPTWQTLSPRQTVYAAPYAMSLRPGATISGTTFDILKITSGYDSGNGLTIQAMAGSNGWGIYSAGSGIGVIGSSSAGTGVYGASANGKGIFGVSGTNVGSEGAAAIVGSSTTRSGVVGYSAGATVPAVAGYHSGDGPAIYGSGGGVYPAVEGLRSDNGTAVAGYASAGTGVLASSDSGVGLVARSTGGNILEGYWIASLPPYTTNRRFYVSNGGNIYADGAYNCGLASGCFNAGVGADVAERIDTLETLQPGDLVEIDPRQPDRFRLARTANSPLVAGVVSTNPAVTMNNNDLADNDSGRRTDQRPLLALVGKVPVKASAENGAIHIGDLVVASNTPGHIMKAGSQPGVGTVVGKALSTLERGTGEILILVMLR